MTGAYSYTITGPEVPADVSNLSAAQQGNSIHISWDDDDQPGLVGVDVFWGEAEQGIEGAYQLASGARNTEITTTKIPPGDWVIYAVWRNINGDVSETPAEFPITVVNYNTLIDQQTYEYIPNYYNDIVPAFAFFQHWTGKLIPKGGATCSIYTTTSPPTSLYFDIDYVSGGSFDDTTYFFKFTFCGNLKYGFFTTGETTESDEASIFVPAGYLPTVSPLYPLSYNVYVSTSSGSETLQNTTPLSANVSTSGKLYSQSWQMPATGLTSTGVTPPSVNTTGWDVFDNFCPNPQSVQYFKPKLLVDTDVVMNKRVSLVVNRNIGYGQSPDGLNSQYYTDYFSFQNLYSGNSSLVFPVGLSNNTPNFTCGETEDRLLQPWLVSIMNAGQVYYIDSITLTVDNEPFTTPLNSVSIGSTGTTVTFSNYGLAYHTAPSVTATPVSTGLVSVAVSNVTTTTVNVNTFTSTGAIAASVNMTITGI